MGAALALTRCQIAVVLPELEGSQPVQPTARAAIERAAELAFSVVAFAEIGVEASIGNLIVLVTADRRFAAYDVAVIDAAS